MMKIAEVAMWVLTCAYNHLVREYVGSLNDRQRALLEVEVNRIMPTRHDPTPMVLVEYQAMKSRMRNILEMLWSVDLTITTSDGYQMQIDKIVSAQPDGTTGWWYVRLPNWKIMRFKPEQELEPMHKLVTKTDMREFFRLQRKLVKAETQWKDLSSVMHYQQQMLGSMLLPHGATVPFTHQPFDEEQKRFYYVEDERTRRADYEWGKPLDPLDAHKPGKLTRKKLIEGEIPVDIGKVTIGGVPFTEDMLTKKDSAKTVDNFYAQLKEMVRWGELELTCCDYPQNFSTMKRMSKIFEVCHMHKNVREKFQERLWNAPYWRVKDKRRQRWYVYSYDWRTHKRAYSHAVIPIGHIEPSRKYHGYYFCMYSEATLEERNQQSLVVADYRRKKISIGFCKWLGLREDLEGQELWLSAYNDWAFQLYRQLQIPTPPKLFPRKSNGQMWDTKAQALETRVFA